MTPHITLITLGVDDIEWEVALNPGLDVLG
jgi:hypothetical protein